VAVPGVFDFTIALLVAETVPGLMTGRGFLLLLFPYFTPIASSFCVKEWL